VLQALLDQLVPIAQFLVLRALQALQGPQDLQVLLVLTVPFQGQQEPQDQQVLAQQVQPVLLEPLVPQVLLAQMVDLLTTTTTRQILQQQQAILVLAIYFGTMPHRFLQHKSTSTTSIQMV
jgi:hypothetical protein